MGTYKRILKDGEVCEDSRVKHNENLGKQKAVIKQLEPHVLAVADKVKPVVAKVSKKDKEVANG